MVPLTGGRDRDGGCPVSHREINNPSYFSCVGKEAHATGQIAARVAKAMARRGKVAETYHCRICGRWHIGRRGKGPAATGKRKS